MAFDREQAVATAKQKIAAAANTLYTLYRVRLQLQWNEFYKLPAETLLSIIDHFETQFDDFIANDPDKTVKGVMNLFNTFTFLPVLISNENYILPEEVPLSDAENYVFTE